MLIKEIKKYTDKILPHSFYQFLERLGLTPNKITFIALFFKILVLYCFYNNQIFLGGIFIAIDYALDYIDGTFARRVRKKTPFGIFFDSVLDRTFRTAGWPIALALGNSISFKLAAFLITFNLLLIYSSNVVESNNLKHFRFFPDVFYLIPYGALLGIVQLAANLEAFTAFCLLIFNIITVLYLNFPRRKY